MELKVLNDTQVKEAIQLLGYYKYFYVCNSCGSVYGCDTKETNTNCPKCILKKRETK